MCILFFAINQHPKFPVVICANRDEFHQRPTQMMHWWPNSSHNKSDHFPILAGKDLQASGTWLGLNQQGRFSALTNYRQPQHFDSNKKSRGELVINALAKSNSAITKQLLNTTNQYNGFNLVFGQLNNLICFDSVTKKLQTLSSGFHSLCNGALDDIWPKMAFGQNQLANAIGTNLTKNLSQTSLVEHLFTLMQNEQQASPNSLPNTGVSIDWEQRLSSIFIASPEYGTRTTNIIILDDQQNIYVYDQSYNEQGEITKQQHFRVTELAI